ncbi:peptidase domain-containing ABC transporter [Sphingomonas sp. XXL09]|uniref:peptidase domain-containing ABC transporter n=1 Tax=Sphingomonas sp. XXL09 TaxID=3457787 RepID=UPI00406BC4EF
MTSIIDLLNFGRSRRLPIIRQSEASECGLACIAMAAAHFGLEVDMPVLRRRFGTSSHGTTLKRVMEIAEGIGLGCRPLRVELDEISDVSLPAILHWDMNHYVVLQRTTTGINGKRYWIADPSRGMRVLNGSEFSRLFTGVAVELRKTSRFVPQVVKSQLRISQFWSSLDGAGGAITAVLLLSGILQVISLVTPFYLQLALDSALPSADHELLRMLALGFCGIAIIEILTSWLRTIALLNMTSAFSFQIINNLYQHLLRLPLSWFEKRHVGDVVSRFNSTQSLTDFISQAMMSAVLDGLMAFITLVLMFVYSPLLAGITLTAWALYVLVRITSFAVIRHSNVNSITANARENSAFIETMRGVSTIKAFGEEATRQRMWQVLKAAAVNAQLKLGRVTAGTDAASGLIVSGERILFVYLAVGLAMRGGFTVGMIFAFQAYKSQFLDAAIRLVDQALRYRLIDVHLTRIADIALSRPEPLDAQIRRIEAIKGAIELKNISFRYGTDSPNIIQNVNLRIEAGEMVAFVGPSGGGKTTLLKILMGLLEPDTGQVLVDGVPLKQLGLRSWRGRIGSVLQDDQLFAGSLAENIAFFDTEIDADRVREACRQAAVLAEIEAMPLGLETLVGDMGSSLSGGQRQRVMLARAIYKDPTLLFMDEGTANLDPDAERIIVDSLRSMTAVTRIVSAHRPMPIKAASRVFLVRDGSICQLEMPTAP